MLKFCGRHLWTLPHHQQRSKQKRGNGGGDRDRVGAGGGPYFRSVAREHQVEVHDRITFECDVGNLGKLPFF